MGVERKASNRDILHDSDQLRGNSYLNYVEMVRNSETSFQDWLRSFVNKFDEGVLLLNASQQIEIMNDKGQAYFKVYGVDQVKGLDFDRLVDMAPFRIKNRKTHPFGEQVEFDISSVSAAVPNKSANRQLISSDPAFSEIIQMAKTIAPTRASVLITGENGTGKEILARLIHQESNRQLEPFVAVNCAALPEPLLESELFGYEKGAFTGAAHKKAGKFELANKGTILLDEISEMDIGLQAKILRVIQEREVDRLGGKQIITLDIRIIATSNINLRDAVRNGSFREDLFYRLNVIHLKIPPLRDRVGDIEVLTKYFLHQIDEQYHKKILNVSPGALELLNNYRWPGNVRELQNLMERAVLFCQGTYLTVDDFPKEIFIGESFEEPVSGLEDVLRPGMTIRGAERRLILKTLDQTIGNRTHAAKMLGISLRTLRNKINEYRKEGYEVRDYE